VVTTLAPVRQRYVELPHNPEHVRAVLRAGAKQARELTREKVRQAKEAIGLLPAWSDRPIRLRPGSRCPAGPCL
jgi:tryptophanyl-tRNA synthetase